MRGYGALKEREKHIRWACGRPSKVGGRVCVTKYNFAQKSSQ